MCIFKKEAKPFSVPIWLYPVMLRGTYCVVYFCSREERPEERERTISHFHYHAWPDFGIPDSPDSFLKFLCLVRQQSGAGGSTENPSTPVRNSSINSHSEHSSVHSPPPVIHCSAGESCTAA